MNGIRKAIDCDLDNEEFPIRTFDYIKKDINEKYIETLFEYK
jgi:hypothetical protein